MGEYSHYCNVSKITINPNTKCVLIPLHTSSLDGEYHPYTLPIYGTYNGYGRLEHIEQNPNSLFLEKYFNVNIEDFTEHLMREPYDDVPDYRIKHYMLVQRDVWDNLSSINYKKPSLSNVLGNKNLLTHLGFEYIGVVDGKYKHKWIMNDHIVYSDGSYLHDENDQLICYLSVLFNIANIKYPGIMAKQNAAQMWRVLNTNKTNDMTFSFIVGYPQYYTDRYTRDLDPMPYLTYEQAMYSLSHLVSPGVFNQSTLTNDQDRNAYNTYLIRTKWKDNLDWHFSPIPTYLDNLDIYGDELAKLYTLYWNIRCFSTSFNPQVDFDLTPQGGERRAHNKILRTFSIICRKMA